MHRRDQVERAHVEVIELRKSELKTRVRTATQSIGDDSNADDVRLAIKRLDKAAAKGVIHPNQAARRKSRLMRAVNNG